MDRKDPWPDCPDPDMVFGTAMLLLEGFEPDGWCVTRSPDGSASYISPRGKLARATVSALVQFFTAVVRDYYEDRRWSAAHIEKVARKWKNEFLLWVWEERDGP